MVTFMLWRSFKKPSSLITTLTYTLMDNFCSFLLFDGFESLFESLLDLKKSEIKKKLRYKLLYTICKVPLLME